MKSASELRLENLETLIKEAGTAEALAEESGVSPEYISQIRNRAIDKKTGRARNLGSQAARKLEAGRNKPIGWMDTSHTQDTNTPSAANLTNWPLKKATPERIRALTPAQAKQADIAFDAILRGYEAEREKS